MRRTLEANMHMADLFPPGRVFWARRDGDLPPSQQLAASRSTTSCSTDKGGTAEKVRLFEVLDTERVFSQIVFSRSMLGYVVPRY